MRRSRTSFACLFIVVAGFLWLSHSTIKEVYNQAKSNWEISRGHNELSHVTDDVFKSESSPVTSPAEASKQIPIPVSPPEPNLNLNLNPIPQSPPQPPPQHPTLDLPKSESVTAFDNTKYPFQEDLTLPLPARDLKLLAQKWPHYYNPALPIGTRYAYATFMNTHNPSIHDPYFMAVQSLIYRVLWRPISKTHSFPFIAFVASHVTQEQRQLLAGAGAIVRELQPLDWNPTAKKSADGKDKPIVGRWKDTFSKLHMWSQTDFDRILFLDADAFPLVNIDEMFTLVPPKPCDASKQEPDDYFPDGSASCNGQEFIFSGVPQDQKAHVLPDINVGAMVFTPSQTMSKRLLQNYRKYQMYNTKMADQAFLAWQFKPDGAFPVSAIDREWGGFFPQNEDKEKLKVVHEKLWASRGWLAEEWMEGWKEMLAWYDGGGFEWERDRDEFFKPKSGKKSRGEEMI